jgi:hypothetical protein
MVMDILSQYAELGFAFAVSAFVLLRLENTIKKNTEAIISLKEEIIKRNGCNN